MNKLKVECLKCNKYDYINDGIKSNFREIGDNTFFLWLVIGMKKNHQDLWFLDNGYINYMSKDKLVFFNLVESYQNLEVVALLGLNAGFTSFTQ